MSFIIRQPSRLILTAVDIQASNAYYAAPDYKLFVPSSSGALRTIVSQLHASHANSSRCHFDCISTLLICLQIHILLATAIHYCTRAYHSAAGCDALCASPIPTHLHWKHPPKNITDGSLAASPNCWLTRNVTCA